MDYITLLETYVSEMSGLSRIQSHIASRDCGMMSAHRGSLARVENQKRNRELKSVLADLGYSVTDIKGSYIEDIAGISPREVSEDSFFIADISDGGKLKDDLKWLGDRFGQDAVIYIPQGP